MASVLKVDTLTGVTTAGSIAVTGEGNSTTTNLQQGLVKAWARFNGTGTAALEDSYNITSLNDNGTGNYTLNYTNSMSNDNYAKADGGGHWTEQSTTDSTATASMLTYSSAASLADYTNVTFMTVGDLA